MKMASVVAVLAMAILSGCATRGGYNNYQQQDMVVPVVYNSTTAQQATEHVLPLQPAPQVVQIAPPPAPTRKYLNIGANPVDPKRPTRPGEKIFTLGEDAYATTKDRAGKVSEGWLKAGEQVFTVLTADPRYWEAVAIKRCGNPILNRERGVAPIWIYDSAAQAPVAQPMQSAPAVQQQLTMVAHTPAPMPVQQNVPECRERKSGWGSVVGGLGGFVVGILTRNRTIAAATSAGGALVGGYFDGGCLEPQDVAVAAGWGIAGYGLTKPKSGNMTAPRSSSNGVGPAPLPSNAGGGPGGIPGN